MLSVVHLTCFLLLAFPIYILLCYIIDQKRLRRFPAPSFSAFSQLWLVYHSSTGQRYRTIHNVHKKLGSAVRIAPNHVSFTDPKAYKDIYGHGSAILKDEFYSNIAEGNPSIAQTTSKAEHTRKRKALAHVFSAREITLMEPRVVSTIEKLCRALQTKSEGQQVSDQDAYTTDSAGVFDVRPWLNMFSYDAITSMFWSNSYGFLDKGNDLCPSLSEDGKMKQVHAMDSFHSAGRFNVMFAQLPFSVHKMIRYVLASTHYGKAGPNFGGMARWQVKERLEASLDEPDLFSHLPYKAMPKYPNPMPVEELIAESATMMDAGNDTTQTSLTNCIYLLARNPEKQRKLYNVLKQHTSPANTSRPLLSYSDQLQHIAYLRSCLDETFRCNPPVAIGLPRRTPASGSTIAGHFIPGDTVVSVPLWTLHHNETLFSAAWDFKPERWLKEMDEDRDGWVTSEQESKNLKDFVLPFSLGGRACIGRNLAYMELSMVIASLVLSFQWELAEPESDLKVIERFNCNPRELKVKARRRDGVNWID